jgi:hypothetical protein
MAELGFDTWVRMTTETAGGNPRFDAGRDNRGAFAIGADSEARTVDAQTYNENNYYVSDRQRQRPQGPIFYDVPNLPNRYQVREADVAEVGAKLLGTGAAVGITSARRAIGLKGMAASARLCWRPRSSTPTKPVSRMGLCG